MRFEIGGNFFVPEPFGRFVKRKGFGGKAGNKHERTAALGFDGGTSG